MSYFLRKTVLFGSCYVRTLAPLASNPGFLRNPDFFPLRLFSSSSNQQSFTVSYLINSLGLSPEAALYASKRVNFYTSEKPEKLINFFKNYGFTHTQILSVLRRSPTLLSLDAQKNILPKLEFLDAKGFSGPERAKMLSVFPGILQSSLSNQIMPSFEFIRDFLQSNEKAIRAVKRYPDILVCVGRYVAPNVAILREHGVADSNVATIMQNWPGSFVLRPITFRKIVEKVENMGFDASKVNFVLAVNVLLSTTKSTWESRVDAYKKWGWSEEDVLDAFRRHPWCMMLSEDKISAGMDLFINKMGSSPCVIAKNPILLSFSMKKRLIPRFLVFQVLLSKGLVKKEVSLLMLFRYPEKDFIRRFVVPYEEEGLELLKLYKEKLDLSNAAKNDGV